MQKRRFTNSITFFVEKEMYQRIIEISDKEGVSISSILRKALSEYFDNYDYYKIKGEDITNEKHN